MQRASGTPTIAATSSSLSSAALLEKFLRTDVIAVTLKFGFQQKSFKYPLNDASNTIIEKLYRDAETWLRSIGLNSRNPSTVERYTLYLFRIPTTDLTMVPIIQLSDIEQNSLIELVIVPVETNLNPHALYRCQLNVPTNCSKCSRLITGIYRQGFRCRKCRMTYHKDCAPFSLDDCSVPVDPPSQTTTSQPLQVSIVYPFDFASTFSTNLSIKSDNTSVPIYSPSSNTSKENAQSVVSTTVIDEGIFPACIGGALIYRRYLFRLTPNTIKISSNLSTMSSPRQQQTRQSNDVDIVFPLGDISDLILTHFVDERDHIFEISFQSKFVLCVGKKSDSDDLQMQAAQFYSSIRDQWEAVTNGVSGQSQPATPTASLPTPVSTPSIKQQSQDLRRKKSIYRRTPFGKDNDDKDLHELYTFTGEKIGEGQFGRVVGAIRKSTNRKVAIKCIEKANCSEEDIRRTNEEIDHLYKFNHVNILKLEAYFEREDAVYIVTERMETDMCKYIMESPNKWLDENMSKMLIYQVIIALRYLHSNNCGHLDVKCENILISFLKPIPQSLNSSTTNKLNQTITYKQDLPLVKLADFGYSRIIGEHSFRKTRVGTKVYCAPEIYRSKEGYNRLVDMWSVGIVLYAALSGTLPYDEKDVHRAEEIVRNKRLMYAHPRWKDVTDEAIDLISNKLLVVQANTRIRSTEALFHAWFTDFHLYKKLREIEKRTEYDFASKQQELPSSSTWLTDEREDSAWAEYKAMYEKLSEQ